MHTTRDVPVDAIAWRVDPTLTGALASQSSSADAQQGSSSVVPTFSSNNNNMPPEVSLSSEANRVNAALRPFSSSAQAAGLAVSLLPPQATGRTDLLSSAQAIASDLLRITSRALQSIDRAIERNLAETARISQSIDRAIVRNQAETARLGETHTQHLAVHRECGTEEATKRVRKRLGCIQDKGEFVADARREDAVRRAAIDLGCSAAPPPHM